VKTPIFHLNSASMTDVTTFCTKLHTDYILHQKRKLVILFGDEQFVRYIWNLKKHSSYDWLLCFPGEFHFTAHVCAAIFSVFGDNLLMPISQHLNRHRITKHFNIKNYDQHHDFLQTVTVAMIIWLSDILNQRPNSTLDEVLTLSQDNDIVACTLEFLLSAALPYWRICDSIKHNKACHLTELWATSLPLFAASNKRMYQNVALLAVFLLTNSKEFIQQIWENRLFSLTGIEGHSIAADMLTEKVCFC
jgi:hypothetical protein